MLPRPVFVEEGFESSRGSLSVNRGVGQTERLSYRRLASRKKSNSYQDRIRFLRRFLGLAEQEITETFLQA
ncbi:MAG: hypothetical protein C0438_03890 [Pseudomonas sp.]|nr:hypothetical protein [Pseudomonas sp.]